MNVSELIPIFYATGGFVVGFFSGLRFLSNRNARLVKNAKEKIKKIESKQIEQSKKIQEQIQNAIEINDLDSVADLASKLLSNYPLP